MPLDRWFKWDIAALMQTRNLFTRLQSLLWRLVVRRQKSLQTEAEEKAHALKKSEEAIEHIREEIHSEWSLRAALTHGLKSKVFFVLATALAAVWSGHLGSATIPFLVFFAAFILLGEVLMRVFGETVSVAIYMIGGITILLLSGFYF